MDGSEEEELRFPGITISPAFHRVEREGQAIDLAAREFDLLVYLARNPRRVFSRDQLLDAVWGYTFAGELSTVMESRHRQSASVTGHRRKGVSCQS